MQIEVPERVWAARAVLDASNLPLAWSAIPAGRASIQAGAEWLRGMSSAIFQVPSVIVPEESAVLVNPLHPDAKKLTAKIVRLFEYNRLFRWT